MPWHVDKTSQCPTSKPWGVIKDSDGKVVPGGCHKTKAEAIKHMQALYVNEPSASMSQTLTGIPIVETGIEYPASTGPVTFTAEDLADIVESQQDPGIVTPRLKLGHTDPRFNEMDGEPAFGVAQNLRLTNNGNTVVADYVGVPDWLAEIMPYVYPNRSVEGNWDVETATGHKWRFVVTDVALLGVVWPGISTLDDLQIALSDAGPEGVGVTTAARAEQLIASINMEDVRRSFYDDFATKDEGRYWWWVRAVLLDPNEIIADDDEGGLFRVAFTIEGDAVSFSDPQPVKIEYVDVPEEVAASRGAVLAASYADSRSSRPDNRTEDHVEGSAATQTFDPAQLRRHLGLPEDATDEQVAEALAAPIEEPEPEPETPEPEPEPVTAASAGETVSIDRGTLEALQRDANLGRQAFETNRINERDAFLSAAVQAGKFPPARVQAWTEAWEREYTHLGNADGVRAAIDGMPEGLVPVGQHGVNPQTEASGAPAYPSSWLPEVHGQHNPAITQEH